MKRLFLLTFIFFSVIFLFSCGEEIGSGGGGDFAFDLKEAKNGELTGCTDPLAMNYQPGAAFDNNSCVYAEVTCEDVDYVLDVKTRVIDNEDLNLPLGSVIGLQAGEKLTFIIRNFHGTPTQPYIFVNCDGQLDVTGDQPGIKLHTNSHIRITGTGSPDHFYGIVVHDTRPFGLVSELSNSDFEVDHLEIYNTAGPAISARTRPVCDGSSNRETFTQFNSIFHHNYTHDAVDGEGFYIGGSHWHSSFQDGEARDCPDFTLFEPLLKGVRVYNNITENTGRDGIQVGNAVEDCKIYNNVVINYGLQNITVHQSGIQLNPGTVGEVHSNIIVGGTGAGMFINGFDNLIHSNIIYNCAKNAFHLGDRNPPDGMSYRIQNNTVVNVGGHAIYMNSKLSVDNIFTNNVLVNITDSLNNKLSPDVDIDISNNYHTDDLSELMFIDPANFDFRPMEGSPLIDAGINTGESLSSDFLMNRRSKGTAIDIGAIESN